MDRFLAIGFLALLLTISGAAHLLVTSSLEVAPAVAPHPAGGVAGVGAETSPLPDREASLSQTRGGRLESIPVSWVESERPPDGGVVYNSRGMWLTDGPQGRPERVDRGPVPMQSVLLPILMYHHVRPIDFKTSTHSASELTLPPTEFDRELQYLQSRGIATVSMEDLYLYLQGREDLPPRAVVLTFDDGYADSYLYVLPILRRYGLKATFFVPTGFIGQNGYVTWGNLKEMVAGGMEIGGHTIAHVDLRTPSPVLRERELAQSKRSLEANLGVSVQALAYPSGAFNADVEASAKRTGYVIAVTTQPGAVEDRSKLMELPRVRISGTDSLAAFRWKIEQSFPLKGPETR